MKLWIDDIRPCPEGYKWFQSVDLVKSYIEESIVDGVLVIEEMDLDHDAGDFFKYGGDYIEILKYIEKLQYVKGIKIPTKFHIHSGNPVGCQRMYQIIKHCGWEEIVYE